MSTVSNAYLVQQIRDAIRMVIDPELGCNIVDLGLIYDIAVDDDGVACITMTTTTPGCPAANCLQEGAFNSAWSVPGIELVDVNLTCNPGWRPDMMSPDIKADLGFADGRNESQPRTFVASRDQEADTSVVHARACCDECRSVPGRSARR